MNNTMREVNTYDNLMRRDRSSMRRMPGCDPEDVGAIPIGHRYPSYTSTLVDNGVKNEC